MPNGIIVNFTPTGMIPTKEQNSSAPLSPKEVIADVKKACEIGISMVHLHARDENGEPHYKKELYEEMILGIREFAPELVICVSTSGRVHTGLEQRSEVLFLDGPAKPDMASLTLSSLNFNKQASINEPSMIMDLAKIMRERGIKPELEAFDSGMINYAKYLITKGLITPPYYFNLILGNIACAQATLLSSGLLVSELPPDALFAFGGIGNYQLNMNSLAVSMGYGVRVGLEDNIWYDRERTVKATNAMLLERIHHLIEANQQVLISSSELRVLLKLESRGAQK